MSSRTAPMFSSRPSPKVLRSGALLAGVLAMVLTGCSGSKEAATGGAPGRGGPGGGRKGGGEVPVQVAAAVLKDVPVELSVVGNVEAYSTISVKAQVGGQLTAVNVHDGDFVKKGELMFTIDQRPFQASVQQAAANNARDMASLSQANANLQRDTAQAKYSAAQAARYAELFKGGIVSRDQSEQQRATADAQAQAVVADRAAIESAKAAGDASKAALETARLQLNYTEIKAPITGRIGNIAVKQGNVVMANTMELTAINQIEPVYVTFAVGEDKLPAIKRCMAERKLTVRAQIDQDTGVDETGALTFVDSAVDTSTGTIKLKGTFANANHKLWPGQFVRVTLRLSMQAGAVVVPNEAVQTGQNGLFAYVVGPDRVVESRPIATGARVGGDVVITQGLQPGESVVTEGQLRLAVGSRVSIRDASGGRMGGGRRSGAGGADGAAGRGRRGGPDAAPGRSPGGPDAGPGPGQGGRRRGGQ
jgi:membrane fusion protein, multidrug efflux system